MTEVTPENHAEIADHNNSLQPEFVEDAQPSENQWNHYCQIYWSKMHLDGLDDEYIDLAFKILKEYEKRSKTKP